MSDSEEPGWSIEAVGIASTLARFRQCSKSRGRLLGGGDPSNDGSSDTAKAPVAPPTRPYRAKTVVTLIKMPVIS